jgi:phosphorylcholine metabolism protein LicD
MLKIFHKLCKKHNITYWVDGGTLLGCIREQGQITWDNDADVGMLPEDYEKFLSIKHELENEPYNYTVNIHTDVMAKILTYNNCMKNIAKEELYLPCLDILVYQKVANLIVIKNKDVRQSYPKSYYHFNDLFPLSDVKYSDITLKGANKPYPYLERYYGEWKTPKIYEKQNCIIKL